MRGHIPAMFQVSATGLSRRFGSRLLFSQVDLTLSTGQVVAITGANGSGKSTLSAILLGQLRPTTGTVSWNADGTVLDTDARRAASWLVAPYLHWYEPLTADENLRFVCEVTGRAFDGRRVAAELERFGLAGRGDDQVRTYSSGMKQRLKLAAVSLLKPGLLVLDEPGSTLDDQGHQAIRESLPGWRSDSAIIIATNDAAEAKLADQTIVLTGATAPPREGAR